jgi:hypothetical protein
VSVDAVKGIAANVTTFGGKRFVVLPYYNTKDFTTSKSVVSNLYKAYKRIKSTLHLKDPDLLK